MALSEDEVRHVAMLARLAVTDDEVEQLAPELNAILGYAEQVGEVAAEDVEPLVHPYPLQNVLREDEPGPVIDREELLAQAPEAEDDRFVVPRIVADGAEPEAIIAPARNADGAEPQASTARATRTAEES